jgi:6-phosphofructokinase 1
MCRIFRLYYRCLEARRLFTRLIEALGARNGIGPELMGRQSGFIAAYVASNADVNLCLVPEVPFSLEGPMNELGQAGAAQSLRHFAAEGAGRSFAVIPKPMLR